MREIAVADSVGLGNTRGPEARSTQEETGITAANRKQREELGGEVNCKSEAPYSE